MMSDVEFGYSHTLLPHEEHERELIRYIMHRIIDAMFDAGVDPLTLHVRWEEQRVHREGLGFHTCIATGTGPEPSQSDE